MNPRSRLLTAVVVFSVIAAGIGFFLVMQKSPEAARLRLLVDVALLAALAGAVVTATRTPLERREELLDAMRALTRGSRERRLDYDRFGDLEDVARAYNELAVALTEHEDPNLGPVKAKRRTSKPPWTDDNHQAIGEVRVISKKDKAAPAEASGGSATAKAESDRRGAKKRAPEEAKAEEPSSSEVKQPEARPASEPPAKAESEPPARAKSELPMAAPDSAPPEKAVEAAAESGRPAGAAVDNDTAIDDAPLPSEDQVMAAVTEAERPPAQEEEDPAKATTLPPFDMRALFDEFVKQKRAHDEDTDDLEYEAFAETLEEEMARLLESHGCRAVRFQVRVQDGEVSLLPRLIR